MSAQLVRLVITLLSRVEAVADADAAELLQATAASLAMMDAPVFMLVDPWPAGDAASSAAKLKSLAARE